MVTLTARTIRSGTGSMLRAVLPVAKKEVLVGIPAENSSRETQSDDNINNAELLYIQSHGVRHAEMRAEMQQHIEAGKKYSEAHSLYMESHGSALWHIPPRPVLEPSVEANKERIGKQLAKASVEAIRGDVDKRDLYLDRAGQVAENAAKKWFENPENGWPPNAPATIRAKGSDSPLIDTGEMRKAITHVIRER